MIAEGEVPTVHMLPPEAQVFDKSAANCRIYFLIDGEEVVYVGKTADIAARIRTHRRGEKELVKKQFTSVRFINVAAAEADNEELRWIRQLRPKYNVHGNRDTRKTRIADGRLTVDVGQELHDCLVRLAKDKGCSLQSLVIRILREAVEREGM